MLRNPLSYFKNFDWILFAAVMLLIGFGLMEIYSVALSQDTVNLLNFKKQILFVAVGAFLLLMFSRLDYLNWRSYGNYLYLLGFLLLLGVLFFGQDIRGTRGWYQAGPFNIQPVEFVKIILLVYLARYFSSTSIKFSPLRHLLITGAGTGILVFLTLRQPDFGSAMILLGVWLAFLLIAGIKIRYVAAILLIMSLAFVFSWFFLFEDYQRERIMTFIDSDANSLDQSYNITQAKIAVGSGQLLGRGVGFGSQSQLKFLPEAQNDFIFAVIAEELGFFGVLIILFLFSVVFYRLFRILPKISDDFGIYLLIGIIALIFIEMFINIGMNIGLVPVIGISLPFLSYGGSAIISTLILIGLAESVIVRARANY